MKKKISLKLFLTVLWRSICQIFQFIGRILGYKDESTYAKVIWRISAGCITALVALLTLGIFYNFTTEVVYRKWIRPYTLTDICDTKYLSKHIMFQEMYNSSTGRIYNNLEKKVLLEDVDWVVIGRNRDSLAVFSQYGKRGYINRFTGEVAIPLSFTKAWVFSEGLAAVEKDDELVFIDHSGKIMISKNLQTDHFNGLNYAFQKGYCIVKDPTTGHLGLIDKTGNWALSPDYDNIFNDYGFWQVEKNNRAGLYTANLDTMFSTTHNAISVYENIIEVRMSDHTAKRYDFEGNILVDFVIDEIENLLYETPALLQDRTENEELDNLKIYDVASCQAYKVYDGRYNAFLGLIDRKGKRITNPLYTSITAINKDLYLCQPDGILLNSKGEVVK